MIQARVETFVYCCDSPIIHASHRRRVSFIPGGGGGGGGACKFSRLVMMVVM